MKIVEKKTSAAKRASAKDGMDDVSPIMKAVEALPNMDISAPDPFAEETNEN